MLKMLYADCLGLSVVILTQFTVKMCAVAKNCQKTVKPFILQVQGHLKSPMLVRLKRSSLVLVMISSMAVPICKRFHAKRANSSKITTFKRYPYLTPPAQVSSNQGCRESGLKLQKSAFNSENFICTLSLAVSAQFALKMCVAVRNQKNHRNLLFKGFKIIQGH